MKGSSNVIYAMVVSVVIGLLVLMVLWFGLDKMTTALLGFMRGAVKAVACSVCKSVAGWAGGAVCSGC